MFLYDKIYFREKVGKDGFKLDVLYTDKIIEEALMDKVFLESIYVASSELYDHLMKLKNNCENISKKTKRNIIKSLTNYYIRFHNRNTPFGLFSAVGVIDAKGDTNKYSLKKEIIINPRWIYELVLKTTKKYPELFSYIFENN